MNSSAKIQKIIEIAIFFCQFEKKMYFCFLKRERERVSKGVQETESESFPSNITEQIK